MKIYEVGGRKVWLNAPPEGYVEPEKPKKTEEKKEEPKVETKAKPESSKSNKARKAGSNK